MIEELIATPQRFKKNLKACFIGTKVATKVFKDEDLIRVDAEKIKMKKEKIVNKSLRAVGAIILNDENKVLMFKRKGEKWERSWEFIKGGVHFGETQKDVVLREIKEEAGIKVKIIKVIPKVFWDEKSYKGGKLKIRARVFICKYLGGKIKLGEPEHVGYKWMSIDEAKKKIWLKAGKEIFNYLKEYLCQNKKLF